MRSFRTLKLDDGSSTLVDSVIGQAMHSRVGAWREAEAIYVEGARPILEDSRPKVIWDVGMGTASNALAAIEASTGPLEVVSFEVFPEGLEQAFQQPTEFPFLVPYRSVAGALLAGDRVTLEKGRVSWRLISGDFFLNLGVMSLPKPDLIFWDFYAPQVVPELWTENAFLRLKQFLGDDSSALLVTYASATAIRTAMMLAGFTVGRGEKTAAKADTTHASLDPRQVTRPLEGEEWIEKVRRSSRPFPYDWVGGEETRDELLKRLAVVLKVA